MCERLAALTNRKFADGNRLLEATDRQYWTPDPETIAALQNAADALEDRMKGLPHNDYTEPIQKGLRHGTTR